MTVEGNHLVVLGLNFRTGVEDIYHAFSEYGDVKECRLQLNDCNESKGYAFITYDKDSQARNALQAMNNKRFDGKLIKVVYSRQNQEELDASYSKPYLPVPQEPFKPSWMEPKRIESKAKQFEKEFNSFETHSRLFNK